MPVEIQLLPSVVILTLVACVRCVSVILDGVLNGPAGLCLLLCLRLSLAVSGMAAIATSAWTENNYASAGGSASDASRLGASPVP